MKWCSTCTCQLVRLFRCPRFSRLRYHPLFRNRKVVEENFLRLIASKWYRLSGWPSGPIVLHDDCFQRAVPVLYLLLGPWVVIYFPGFSKAHQVRGNLKQQCFKLRSPVRCHCWIQIWRANWSRKHLLVELSSREGSGVWWNFRSPASLCSSLSCHDKIFC